MLVRRPTVTVDVAGVKIGAGHPVVVQSMTNTDTADADATAARFARYGINVAALHPDPLECVDSVWMWCPNVPPGYSVTWAPGGANDSTYAATSGKSHGSNGPAVAMTGVMLQRRGEIGGRDRDLVDVADDREREDTAVEQPPAR
jgi:hypothetical protein